MQQVKVRVPGSCGELIQGQLNGQDFLISCPVNLYSQALVKILPETNTIKLNKDFSKSYKAARKTLEYYQLQGIGLEIEIDSELLIGQGMASSTADMAAVVSAIMLLINKKIDYRVLIDILLGIEPTDSIFLPGFYKFDHLNGQIIEKLGPLPEFEILIFRNDAAEINTLAFNNSDKIKSLKEAKEQSVNQALKYILTGINTRSKKLIGQGITLSSLAHQEILPKTGLIKINDLISKYQQIYGLNIAHSGNLIGLFIQPGFKNKNLIKNIEHNSDFKFYQRARLISGGIERVI